MKILITGAKGMLGQAIVSLFATRGHEVIGLDREELDITNEAAVMEKFKELKPRIVINCAAYNAVDLAESEQEAADRLNGYAVSHLARACRKLTATLVHYSTDYVFDGIDQAGYNETAKPNPINIYGRSKLLGEKLLQEQWPNRYLLRVSRLFGPAGASAAAKESFVDKMLKLSETRDSLEVIDEEVSSPTYVKDVAEFTLSLIEDADQAPFGLYHAANSGVCTWHKFAREIFHLAGKEVKLIPISGDKFNRAAKRPAYAVLLNTKRREQRPWQIALADYLKSI